MIDIIKSIVYEYGIDKIYYGFIMFDIVVNIDILFSINIDLVEVLKFFIDVILMEIGGFVVDKVLEVVKMFFGGDGVCYDV